ncbi:class I SAM-dependent methyltransferase [Dokdonella sp.]|uniref:class I SAM-dependent methyltransferase n=1 Tax=Dokdonella sp. TaxID=2291710 RepID=UPI0031BDBF1E|nr:class I SAM-dependent methyltransferase [Dokdonella sp.]
MNDPLTDVSTHQRVINDYLRTTSIASGTGAELSASTLAGLRRRLGPWLDVAGKDVLDLGSGLGETCRVCHDAGAARVVGVNLSQGEIDFARNQVDAHFVCSDIAEFLDGCERASFDRVFALNILEHLDKDKLARVLEGARRVLRPGGTLVAMVPNATSPYGSMTRYWDITHLNAFTPSSVRQMARLCGFAEQVEFRECGPVPHGPTSTIRYLLWQGVRAAIKLRLLVELASTKGGVYTADMLMRLHKAQ